ncbi:MAG: hypothetical protein QM665_01135 [Desulfovibrio sp.]
MARHILNIKSLGEKASWLLVQQALGMPEPKLQTDFMAQRVALLMFSQHSLPERLCVSAAVRQMGGAVVYEGSRGSWRNEMNDYQEQLLPVFSYYIDCMYCMACLWAGGTWRHRACASRSSMRAARMLTLRMRWPT